MLSRSLARAHPSGGVVPRSRLANGAARQARVQRQPPRLVASRLFGTDEDALEDELQRKETERFVGLVAHLQQHGKRARSAVSASAVSYAKEVSIEGKLHLWR